jgi:ribosomal protein S18 acetylase RimI-like enzyme
VLELFGSSGPYPFEPNFFIDRIVMSNDFSIREYRDEDFDAVTILWRIAREKAMPDFQRAKGHFFYEDQWYFQNRILNDNKVWVVANESRSIAFMAIKDEFIDHLYVHPDYWRQGIGKQLLQFAREIQPEHIWLYTLQVNTNARAFYEKNGFVAEKFGISPAPESEPDVEYHWRKK